jgi:hypothetical protein
VSQSDKIRTLLQNGMARLKELFIESFKADKRKDSNKLFSLSIIGRPIEERRIDTVMDIDIIVLLNDPMTLEKYNKIENIFSNLQNYENKDALVSYKIADGPIKPLPVKKHNIFFHVLLHTIKSYRDSPLVLVKNSWQHESKAILGLPISKIERINGVTLDELLNGKLGIKHCKKLITDSSSTFLEWMGRKDNDDKLSISLKPIRFSENHELLEICYYSVLRAASNTLRYLKKITKGIGIDIKDMIEFEKTYGSFKKSKLPIDMYYEKAKLRKGEYHPLHRDAILRMEQSLEFLTRLERELINSNDADIIK